MSSRCILCQNNPPIKESHIIPNFVVKRLKAGNPLKILLHSNDLGRVYQDGWKGAYLCSTCEQSFSRLEHWFCQAIYDPFIVGNLGKTNYDERLGLFMASICFRYIHLALERNLQKSASLNLRNLQENLRASLFSGTFQDISSHLYVQFLCPVHELDALPPGINTYFFETIDGRCFDYVIPNDGTFWIVFVKIPGILIVLSEWDLQKAFKGPSLLDEHNILQAGTLAPAEQSGVLFELVREDCCKRAVEIQNNYAKLPPKRLVDMANKIGSLADKDTSRAHQSFLLDQKLLTELLKRQAG